LLWLGSAMLLTACEDPRKWPRKKRKPSCADRAEQSYARRVVPSRARPERCLLDAGDAEAYKHADLIADISCTTAELNGLGPRTTATSHPGFIPDEDESIHSR
jgi:hypothetical protein